MGHLANPQSSFMDNFWFSVFRSVHPLTGGVKRTEFSADSCPPVSLSVHLTFRVRPVSAEKVDAETGRKNQNASKPQLVRDIVEISVLLNLSAPYEAVQLSVQRRPLYPDHVLDRLGLVPGHAILAQHSENPVQ